MPGFGIWSPGGCGCDSSGPTDPCAPCDIPASGSLNFYWLFVATHGAGGGDPCRYYCAEQEYIGTLAYNAGTPPVAGLKAGYWIGDCFDFIEYADSGPPEFTCLESFTYRARIILGCTSDGSKTQVWLRRWPFGGCETQTGFTEDILLNSSDDGNLVTTVCSPFELRWNVHYSDPGCASFLIRDMWIFV